MKTIDLIQGSPEWLAHRAQFWNASDAPAMMGCSPYMTRTELLTRMKTGISAEVDAATQRRFDDGHRFEALARPLAEKIIGEELYPVTGTNGQLSASFDGLTMLGDTAFEHKTLNLSMAGLVWVSESAADFLPLHYLVQMEQQMLVSGADRVLFMASTWNGDALVEERHCWYASDAALRAKIIAGWAQFANDLAEFVPSTVEAPKPTGKAPESLPALHIVIQGGVSASNLDEFKETALGAIRSVNRELTTDVHFADAEKAVKWCSDIEDRIKAAKDHALSQTASIDALFRTMDEISAEARRVRLDLDKLVKARKEAVKGELVAAGVAAMAKHIRELNASMPADYMPQVPADFGGCIKGLRTVDSIRNAVDTELARAKIEASEIANRIHANVKTLKNSGLVAHDAAALVLKQPDDLAAVIAQRIAAEKAREEAQRERIRAEEVEKLERERIAAERAERKVREAAEEMARQREAAQAMQRAAAPAVLPPPPAPPAPVAAAPVAQADTSARIALGHINRRLDPVQITAAGLAELGFEPVGKERASVLYLECDFPAMCRAIADHALAAAHAPQPA